MRNFKYLIVITIMMLCSISYSYADMKVMIDPGHGGYDAGAISYDKKHEEKALNLDTALAIRDELQKHGVTVYMTREDDKFVSLSERSEMANKIKDLDVLISLHHNSSSNNKVYRTEVIYQAKNEKEAQKLAESISNKLSEITDELKIYTRYNQSGGDYYSILRRTNTVANIVEVSFISSEKGYTLVDTHEKRVRNGILVAEGIMDYLGIPYDDGVEEKNKTKLEKVNKSQLILDKLLNLLNDKRNKNEGLSALYEILNRGE